MFNPSAATRRQLTAWKLNHFMKSTIKYLTLGILMQLGSQGYSQEQQPAFFSFVNAVNSDSPTILTVNGTKMGDPFPLGYYSGGMGFVGQSATISIENDSLPPMRTSIPLKPDTSPIVIAYLKLIPSPEGSDAPPKKTIGAIALPCSPDKSGSGLRAVYIGGEQPITVNVKSARSNGTADANVGPQIKLAPGVPIDVPLKSSPLEFFSNGESIGVHDADAGESYILVFFPRPNRKLGFVSALDQPFH
jgi:hypothetical protein